MFVEIGDRRPGRPKHDVKLLNIPNWKRTPQNRRVSRNFGNQVEPLAIKHKEELSTKVEKIALSSFSKISVHPSANQSRLA
uniref:Uncharacterized protein n=1 Tax=Megaselia scalaris TaxID=36166 RepID=T1GMM3_MEGSC